MSALISTRPTGITILSILAGLEGVFGSVRRLRRMGLGWRSVDRVGQRILGLASSPWARCSWSWLGVLDTQALGWPLGVVLAIGSIILAVLGILGSNGDILSTIVASPCRLSSCTT